MNKIFAFVAVAILLAGGAAGMVAVTSQKETVAAEETIVLDEQTVDMALRTCFPELTDDEIVMLRDMMMNDFSVDDAKSVDPEEQALIDKMHAALDRLMKEGLPVMKEMIPLIIDAIQTKNWGKLVLDLFSKVGLEKIKTLIVAIVDLKLAFDELNDWREEHENTIVSMGSATFVTVV